MTQQKMVIQKNEPVVVHWEVDEATIGSCVPWAKSARGKQLLREEISEMEKRFPSFLATVAKEERLEKCPGCGDFLIWRDGIECLSCQSIYNPFPGIKLAFWGLIPSLLGKIDDQGSLVEGNYFPVLKKIIRDMEKSRGARSQTYNRYIGEVTEDNDYYYLYTPVTCILPDDWNYDVPSIHFEDNYFQIIGLEKQHVYNNGRLCLYRSWPRVSIYNTLQQRVVPRIMMDLMFASLKSIGRLDDVLSSLGISLHEAYNWIGKPRRSERFQEAYSRFIRI